MERGGGGFSTRGASADEQGRVVQFETSSSLNWRNIDFFRIFSEMVLGFFSGLRNIEFSLRAPQEGLYLSVNSGGRCDRVSGFSRMMS